MTKFLKSLFVLLLVFVSGVALASCNNNNEDQPKEKTPEELAAELADAKSTARQKVDALTKNLQGSYDDEVITQVGVLFDQYVAEIDACETVEAAANKANEGANAISEYLKAQVKYANGTYSYVASSYDVRTEILGILEKYAVDAGLTGLTLYQSAGLALYNDGVQLGTQTYIVGYGFGAIAEGGITTGLSYEGMNPNYAKYYHSYETEDPKTINYANDKGSVVGDLQPYIAESFWGTRMNDTKDGYEWYNSLALTSPQAVNAIIETEDGTVLSSHYKFDIKTGSALKYNTLSSTFASYNNREVAAEDYLTPFKLLWTQKNGYARALDNDGTSQDIKGATAYYNASAEGFNENAWKNVGLWVEDDNQDGVWTFHVEFVVPCTPFYAMYYMSSSIYAPIPQQFIDDIGGAANYGCFVSANGYTPVDTTLSTGQFTLESWVQDQEIVFKKNPNVIEEGRYNVEGVHLAILAGIKTDKELAFKEFMAGKLSACGVPSTQLENFQSKTEGVSETNKSVSYYVKQTNGGSTYKLNFNTCTQAVWHDIFGEDGEDDAWECEPIMSNHDFYLGLSYSLNRKGLADKLGCAYSMDYFGDVYLSDPEAGVAYNSTDAHKDATSSLRQDGDKDGFDIELARQYFKKACDALLADGTYKEGDTITVEIAWMYPTDEEESHNFIASCFETAFNDPSVCGGKLTLDVVFWVGSSWSDVYYKKMMTGEFDIGFGSISGNSLNPLNFLEVLRSDNSSGFTLNWGCDTSVVDPALKYDGVVWSFNSLWIAADQGGYFSKSQSSQPMDPEFIEAVDNGDGTQTLTFKVNAEEPDGVKVVFDKAVIFAYDGEQEYFESKLEASYDKSTDIITVIVSADIMAEFADENLLMSSSATLVAYGYAGIDLYFLNEYNLVPSSKVMSVAAWFNVDSPAE